MNHCLFTTKYKTILHLNLQGGGGGGSWSICRGKSNHFNEARWRADSLKCITDLHRTVLKYLIYFMQSHAKNCLFQKYSSPPPPPGDGMMGVSSHHYLILTHVKLCFADTIHNVK